MAVIRFTTTQLSGLQAAGRVQELQHAVIAPFLERELGPSFGRLFADFEVEGSDVRAWYVEADAPPRSITTMTPADQAELRQHVAEMIARILDFAGRIASESLEKAKIARILTDATTFPAEDIWALGGQPIIVNWGFHRGSVPVGPPRAILDLVRIPKPQTQPGLPPVAPPPPTATVEATGRDAAVTLRRNGYPLLLLPTLLWVLFALFVAGSYWRLLPACGFNQRLAFLWTLPTLDACTHGIDRLTEDGTRLQGLVDQEELRVAQRNRQCAIGSLPHDADATPRDTPPRNAPPGDATPRAATPEEDRKITSSLPPDAPRGEVEVSLAWNDKSDLDLIVECPGGDKLWHGSDGLQACGGRLQQDVNKAGDTLTDTPVEQAAWATPPAGEFTIEVQLWSYNDVPPDTDIPFKIRIRRGNEVKIIEGHIHGRGTIMTVAKTTI